MYENDGNRRTRRTDRCICRMKQRYDWEKQQTIKTQNTQAAKSSVLIWIPLAQGGSDDDGRRPIEWLSGYGMQHAQQQVRGHTHTFAAAARSHKRRWLRLTRRL